MRPRETKTMSLFVKHYVTVWYKLDFIRVYGAVENKAEFLKQCEELVEIAIRENRYPGENTSLFVKLYNAVKNKSKFEKLYAEIENKLDFLKQCDAAGERTADKVEFMNTFREVVPVNRSLFLRVFAAQSDKKDFLYFWVNEADQEQQEQFLQECEDIESRKREEKLTNPMMQTPQALGLLA